MIFSLAQVFIILVQSIWPRNKSVSIKLLKDIYNEPSEFYLNEFECILLVLKKDNKDLYLISDVTSKDMDELISSSDISEIRVVGQSSGIEKLVSLEHKVCEYLKKKKTIDSNSPVVFLVNENIIKFKRQKQKSELAQKKKVLIIDDSYTIQKLLTKIINQSDYLEVTHVASSPSQAKEILKSFRPDVITLDIHMPEMDGVTFYKTFLKSFNIPTACISSISMNEGPLILEALSNGVLTYIQKPDLKNIVADRHKIIEKLEAIRNITKEDLTTKVKEKVNSDVIDEFNNLNELIAIGSSTGGTQALENLLTQFPKKIPPVVIVQHIPEVFSKALAERLDRKCAFTIKEVEHNDLIQKNTVYIAKGGSQFKVKEIAGELRAILTDDSAMNSFKPSVDYLFESINNLSTNKGVGVILTGMGKDGAKGLLKLKNKGFYTIAQDEASSIVYGMPKVAFDIGATVEVVNINNMASAIIVAHNHLNK